MKKLLIFILFTSLCFTQSKWVEDSRGKHIYTYNKFSKGYEVGGTVNGITETVYRSIRSRERYGMPFIRVIQPYTASAGTNSIIEIKGMNFDTSGAVLFYYVYELRIKAKILYWSDSLIRCDIPVNGIESASSGNITIQNKYGMSNPYFFNITFSYGGNKWNVNNINFVINSELREEVDNSFLTYKPYFNLYDNGLTDTRIASYNSLNTICYGMTAYNTALAEAYVWSGEGKIFEADIIFNENYKWSSDGSEFDIESVALHELGHCLGLRDLYGESDSKKAMFGFLTNREIKRSLSIDDISGIRWIYPKVNSVLEYEQSDYKLLQNYPNPFNNETIIMFDLDKSSDVKLFVSDPLGREIVLLNEYVKAGKYRYTFNAGNLPSGIYFYSLIANNYRHVKKMLLLK